jgi:PAS domain-containing protein
LREKQVTCRKQVNGKVTYVLAISHDITDMKEAETKLRETLDSLEEKVKERTADLEEAYRLLLENERRLYEAQKTAHIGNWERDIATDELYWSEEMYRILGFDPQESGATQELFLSCVHPDDRGYLDSAVKEALNGHSLNIDYRIISVDGGERVVHEQGEVIFDEKISLFE